MIYVSISDMFLRNTYFLVILTSASLLSSCDNSNTDAPRLTNTFQNVDRAILELHTVSKECKEGTQVIPEELSIERIDSVFQHSLQRTFLNPGRFYEGRKNAKPASEFLTAYSRFDPKPSDFVWEVTVTYDCREERPSARINWKTRRHPSMNSRVVEGPKTVTVGGKIVESIYFDQPSAELETWVRKNVLQMSSEFSPGFSTSERRK